MSVIALVVVLAGSIWSQSSRPERPRVTRTNPAIVADWQNEIERAAGRDRFTGAVLVARNGKALFRRAYGLADREQGISNRPDTRFRIGSMNKMFTAIAVAQLAQRGKLRFSDPVSKYLRDYPNKQLAETVTVEHLLTHTGGTGDIFGPEFVLHRLELNRLSDYLTLFGRRALTFQPGSRFGYSNYGFILLGLIIERISGQSYYDYVREHIFEPAGMMSTDSAPESMLVPDLAVGYTRRGSGELRRNTDTLPPRGTSAGGGYSTVDDLLSFSVALMEYHLLNRSFTERVTRGRVVAAAGPDIRYGYGFFVKENSTAAPWFGHGGGAPGMNGELRIYPQSGHVVAVLSNADPPMAANIAVRIGGRLPMR